MRSVACVRRSDKPVDKANICSADHTDNYNYIFVFSPWLDLILESNRRDGAQSGTLQSNPQTKTFLNYQIQFDTLRAKTAIHPHEGATSLLQERRPRKAIGVNEITHPGLESNIIF